MYIIWNGVSSETINGLLIQQLPPITSPNMRISESFIDGKDGSFIEELGYSSYDKSIQVALYGNYDIDAVIGYFRGSGTVIFSNEPDKYYNARIVGQIDFNRLLRYRTATIKFKIQPFKYEVDEDEFVYYGGGEENIDNEGNVEARPIFVVQGSDTVPIIIDGVTICEYTFPEDEFEVYIDSETEDAYIIDDDGVKQLRNRNMVGEFPKLKVGENTLSSNDNVWQIDITKRSRWL